MSTIVYQELQQSSIHESQFFDSRTLSLKLNSSNLPQSRTHSSLLSSKPEYVPKITASSSNNSNSSGSFSSIEALSSKKDGKESVYVHPLVKQSEFILTEKSLQMCTESLGSETGSCCDTGSSIFSPPMTVDERKFPPKITENVSVVQERIPRPKYGKVKKDMVLDYGNFPPALTTIRGSNPMQVKPYRENGRLVIQAVTPPPVQSYMQAERSNGRLTLTLVSNDVSDENNNDDDIDVDDECCCSFDDQQVQTETNNNNDDNNNDGLQIKVEKFEEQQKDVEENTEKGELKGCNKSNAYLLEDDISGKKVEFGVKLGLGKIQRPSRCKERSQGNMRLINWEPFWVAI